MSAADSEAPQPQQAQPPAAEVVPDDHGPFSPPTNYLLEPELQDPPPRPIPAELRQGRHGRGQRRVAWGLLAAGLCCLASAPMPIVHTWALFLLPLKFIGWVGAGLTVFAIGAFAAMRMRGGPYRYVEEGLPVVARVVGLTLRPVTVMDGTPATYRFDALIQYRDPATGAEVVTPTSSNDFSAGEKDRLTTSYRTGDCATALYLPNDPAGTIKLYGFLDLKPGLGLVRREGAQEAGPLGTLLAVFLIFGIFGVLGWNVYAYGRYAPMELKGVHAIPFAAGAALLGLPVLVLAAVSNKRAERRRAERTTPAREEGEPVEVGTPPPTPSAAAGCFLAAFCVAGALLLGGVTGMCSAFAANALLDDSAPQRRPVLIRRMVMTTHNFIFREYKIEYQIMGTDEKRDFMSTPAHIEQFQVGVGIPFAEVRAGRFGWAWVEDIKLFNPDVVPAGPPQ